MKRSRVEAICGFLFISPWVVGFMLFTGGPIIASLVLSFYQWDLITAPNWIGAANYKRLSMDETFLISIYNTFYFTILAVPLRLTVALIIAMLVNQRIKGIAFFRTMFYLPAIIPLVPMALLWVWLLSPDIGLVNFILSRLGVQGPLWLASLKWSKPALILMRLFTTGGTMVIFLAGFQGIPQRLYESAQIDGAGWWYKFVFVTLPMLSPAIFFNLVIETIRSFQIFTEALIMTEGGPANSTLFYYLYLYLNAFRWFRMGYASAMAWILFMMIFLATLIHFGLASRWVYYEAR